MRIGVFGGTFDPPHIGHLILASEAQQQYHLDRVLWVLTPYPPHKKSQKISLINDRLHMVKQAISANKDFSLSHVDVDRDPPHYAVDTMEILKAEMPGSELFYLMGLDSINDLTTWHKPANFVHLCDGIILMQRQGVVVDTSKLEMDFPGISLKLHFLPTPIIEISSSEIRLRVATGKPFRYFVPNEVYQFIINRKLYQN
jgi:nicotinate-nucleotide adenylyltransferase